MGYWLMIAGTLLVVVGFIGLVFRRNKEEIGSDPISLPGQTIPEPSGAEGEGEIVQGVQNE